MTRKTGAIVVDLLASAYEKVREAGLMVEDAKEMNMIDHTNLSKTIEKLEQKFEEKIKKESQGLEGNENSAFRVVRLGETDVTQSLGENRND